VFGKTQFGKCHWHLDTANNNSTKPIKSFQSTDSRPSFSETDAALGKFTDKNTTIYEDTL
jgi:hypothetical protein